MLLEVIGSTGMSDASDCVNYPVLWVEPKASGKPVKNLTY